jgi:hypothetical protein
MVALRLGIDEWSLIMCHLPQRDRSTLFEFLVQHRMLTARDCHRATNVRTLQQQVLWLAYRHDASGDGPTPWPSRATRLAHVALLTMHGFHPSDVELALDTHSDDVQEAFNALLTA